MLRLTLAVLIALPLLSQTPPPTKPPKPPPAARRVAMRAHPDVGTGDCADCHRATHPPVAADYESSKHGRGLVGCPVCHGPTQAGFVAKPGPERCQPCHAVQVDSLKTPVMKNKDCWSCHVPHRLNPHMALHKNDPNGGTK